MAETDVAPKIARLTALNAPCPCGDAGWLHVANGCIALKKLPWPFSKFRFRRCGCSVTAEQHITNQRRGS